MTSEEMVHRQRCLVMGLFSSSTVLVGGWTLAEEELGPWGLINDNGALRIWSGSSSTEHRWKLIGNVTFSTADDLDFS